MRSTLPILAAATLLLACGEPAEPMAPPTASSPLAPASAPPPSPLPWSGATVDYADELDRHELLVDTMESRVEANPDAWIYREQAAVAWLGRARLSGSWDDYARADAHLAEAFARSETASPWGALASLRHSLHRFDALPEAIDGLAGMWPQSDARRADVLMRRGNLDLAQGRYEQARERLEESVLTSEGVANTASLAVLHWRFGAFDVAQTLFVDAGRRYHSPPAEPRAWVHLNLGLLDLDRGSWTEALSHYRDAERELRGSWLVEEHIAEVLVLLGQTAEAERIYRDVIARTDAPEFMDALSGLLADRGDDDEAAALQAQARARWEALLDRFPEAAYGHALAHYLDAGDAPERALELAAANHALRPDGEAKKLLARARLATGDVPGAVTVIEEALASPWESADLHAVAAEVYAAAGDDARAEAERASALAINPRALD